SRERSETCGRLHDQSTLLGAQRRGQTNRDDDASTRDLLALPPADVVTVADDHPAARLGERVGPVAAGMATGAREVGRRIAQVLLVEHGQEERPWRVRAWFGTVGPAPQRRFAEAPCR